MGLQPGTIPVRAPGGLFAGSTSTGGGSSSGSGSTSAQTAQQATGTRTDSSGGGGGHGGDQQPHDRPQHLPAAGTTAQAPAPAAPAPRDTPQSRKLEQQIAGLRARLKDVQARLGHGGAPQDQSSLIHQQEALDLQIKELEAAAAHLRREAGAAPEAKATEPDILKEAGMTATLDPEIVYTSFPIEKMEEEGDTLYVYGKATTPDIDSDEQVVDSSWSGSAMKTWFETGPNIRVQHNGQRDPAGSGVKVEIDRDGDGAHWVKAAIDEPIAQRLVKKGHLRAFSVGIARPLIVRDVTGKARNGIIKGGELAEISLVDRPANRSCYMEIAKAAKDGTCEFTGKVHGADLLTKAAPDDGGTVNVDVPKGASITFSPGDLAKLLDHRRVAGDRETDALKAAAAAEHAIYKRDIDTATRRRLAADGKALPNLSYPIENADDLGNAATLARSGHGDVGAARKLIARRAKELGVANPLDEDDKVKAGDVDAAKPAEPAAAAPAAVVKDGGDTPQLHHDDGEDDDTDSDADAMDKSAAPAPAMAKKPKMPCPKCKGMNKAKAKFCGKCGAPMTAEKTSKPTPGDGVTGEHTMPAPEHREPDGPAIEALEHDAHLPTTPDSSVKNDDAEEMAVAARHKTLGVDREMGMLHDLTCAAYDPADVAKSYPGTDFSAINVQGWLDKTLTLAATAPLEQAREAGRLVETAITLKNVTPDLADGLREEAHKAFRDANPGPGKAPTPGELSAERFRRPLITAGHSAPSPGQDAPHTSPVHPQHISAADYRRDLITAGHAADSPGNDPGHPMPVAAPEVPGVPSRVFYTRMQRENAQQAMRSMHDHIASTFPDLCPMHGPGRMGEPPSHARPVPVGVGGPVPHGATKAAEPVTPDEFEQSEAAARAARKAARKQQRELLDAIIKGEVSVEDARTQLGAEPVTKAAAIQGEAVTLETSNGVTPDLIKSAIAEATAPLMDRLSEQDAALAEQRKLLDAMADQPDPRVAAYRGVALNKTSAPAGLLNSPERPAGVKDAAYRAMYDQWRNSPDPELRENALAFLMDHTGLNPKTHA